MSPCRGISDKIDNASNTIDEREIIEVKVAIRPMRFFRNYRLTSKFCSVNHLVTIECLFLSRMSLASIVI